MRKLLDAFSVTIPPGWTDDSGGGTVVLHGPAGEEVIISAASVDGSGPAAEGETIRRRLVENGHRSVRSALSHPELVQFEAEVQTPLVAGTELWLSTAHTQDRIVFFAGAVIAAASTVVVLTFEAPNAPGARAGLTDFLRTNIQRAS